MKWILTSNHTASVHVFSLMEGNIVREVLRYNPLQQSARITCMGKQRLFFIEQAGYHHKRFIFKNEYGFTIGKLFIENPDAEGGSIEIEDKKLHYRTHANPAPGLAIYEQNEIQPLLTCSFSYNTGESLPISASNRQTIHEYASLLLGLSWYLFGPAGKHSLESAALLSFA